MQIPKIKKKKSPAKLENLQQRDTNAEKLHCRLKEKDVSDGMQIQKKKKIAVLNFTTNGNENLEDDHKYLLKCF